MKFTQDDLIRTERELRDPDAFKVQSKYTLEFEIEDLPKLYNSINRSHWAVIPTIAGWYKWEKAPRGKGKIKVKVEEIE